MDFETQLQAANQRISELQGICNRLMSINQELKVQVAELEAETNRRNISLDNINPPQNSVMEFLLKERKQFEGLVRRLKEANYELRQRIETEKLKWEVKNEK